MDTIRFYIRVSGAYSELLQDLQGIESEAKRGERARFLACFGALVANGMPAPYSPQTQAATETQGAPKGSLRLRVRVTPALPELWAELEELEQSQQSERFKVLANLGATWLQGRIAPAILQQPHQRLWENEPEQSEPKRRDRLTKIHHLM